MRAKSTAVAISLSSLLLACGSDGNAGDAPDAGADEGPCGFEQRYLPYQDGYSWNYRVTNLGTPEVATKTQSVAAATDPDLGEVLVQTTIKANGTTISALRVEGDVVLRLRQEDRDASDTLVRTTTYDPGQVRIDQSIDKTALGAQWDVVYTVVETDSAGVETARGDTIDHWEVLGVDVDCSSPLGDFKCLQLRRQRTAGGISDKQFFFAKGVGKVKEVNANQVEELLSCQ